MGACFQDRNYFMYVEIVLLKSFRVPSVGDISSIPDITSDTFIEIKQEVQIETV